MSHRFNKKKARLTARCLSGRSSGFANRLILGRDLRLLLLLGSGLLSLSRLFLSSGGGGGDLLRGLSLLVTEELADEDGRVALQRVNGIVVLVALLLGRLFRRRGSGLLVGRLGGLFRGLSSRLC